MAVNSIVFGGVDSADYGIYISGEGVFDAPKRDVEMIEIPGRNGAFALDNGRFENIEVTYPAFNFEPNDYETFAQNLSDFRNALCSQKGYQRLTDSFHPDEYRMAVYREGLDVKPVKYNTASEFNIVFDCKPQRWLTSGESAVSVESGDTLTNPTLFESSPMLEAYGYGSIQFNGYEIEIESVPLGIVTLNQGSGENINLDNSSVSFSFNSNVVATGDAMYFSGAQHPVQFYISEILYPSGTVFTDSNPDVSGSSLSTWYENVSFVKGTPKTITNTRTYTNADYPDDSATFTTTIDYDGNDTITFSASKVTGTRIRLTGTLYMRWFQFYGDSTVQAIGNPTYIDCDLGEAYMISGGEIVSLNSHIDLGSNLPELASGSNEFTLDNTITDLKVVPRWWKI